MRTITLVLMSLLTVSQAAAQYDYGFDFTKAYQQGRKVSKMISGNPDSNLQVKAYHDTAEAIQILRAYLAIFR